MIDFADHFWGDKQNGYNVLYQNMKSGQTSVKELTDFLKERSLIEEEYQKHLSKLIKQILNVGAVGTFSAVWIVIKSSLEKFLQLHGNLIQQLHDVAKDVHKYGEDQQKAHKLAREADVKTLETVNLMQTTTTCLQKSKENYTARCVEHEKLKRENAPLKELQKSENRLKKAADEYRQYVEKYGKIRDNYEQRMITSSRNFQEFEANHLNQMKQLTLAYALAFEGSQNLIYQASLEFREQMESINVEEILRDFANKKGTGTERPSLAVFEEPDLNVLLPGSDSNASLFLPPEDASTGVTPLAPLPSDLVFPPSAAAADSILTLDYSNDNNNSLSMKQNAVANGPSSNVSNQQSANKKLSLWLPGRKKTTQSASKLPTPTPSPSGDVAAIASSSNDGGGFLRKKKDSKKKKDKESDNKSEISSEDAKSQSSGGKNPNALADLIDEEGYSIRPTDDARRSFSKINESSSDEDSDEDEPRKLKIEIKKHPVKTISASVDELKDAFKDVNIGLYAASGVGSKQRLSKDISLDDFDPMKSSFANDPWNTGVATGATSRHHHEPLRPAKTGDDRYNRSNFVGLHWPSSHSTSLAGAAAARTDEPWSAADENGDTLGRLVDSVSWSTSSSIARARPRSSTPTQSSSDAQMSFNASPAGTNNHSWDQATVRQQDSLDFSSTSSPSSSALSFGSSPSVRNEPAPLAVALTETVHVVFKGSNLTGCIIKIYGNLAVSFPAALAQMLTNDSLASPPALVIKLVNADKIHAVMPNRQVLPTESIFKSDSSHEFPFDMHSLITYLKQRLIASPSIPFFNLDVLRYEVRTEPGGGSAPLQLQSYWKCQPSQTDIVVQYNYNSSCPIAAPLLNIQFSTQVDGEVTQAQLKPEGSWNSDDNRLIWKMTELSRHGESSGSLKARLTAMDGPSTPAPTVVNFQMNDVCLSGADVQLVGFGYRISLLKKKIVAGKYSCEPESR